MPVGAVALLESAYPIGSQSPFWAHPVVVGAMGAANEPCHADEQRDPLVRVTDQRYRQRSGRLNVNSQEAADVAHPT